MYAYFTVLSWSDGTAFQNADTGLGCNLMHCVLGCLPSSSLSVQFSLSLVVPHLKPLLLSGILIGYLVQHKKDTPPSCAASVLPFEDPVPHETGAAPLMDWDDVKKLLAQKLSAEKFEPIFR